MNTIAAIKTIERDFLNRDEPFDTIEFPEEKLLRKLSKDMGRTDTPTSLSMEEKATAITMFSTFDYNRNANQLVNNIIELNQEAPQYFIPYLVDGSDELSTIFEEIGFRYPNRDANAWNKNCKILCDKYHGSVLELILSTNLDAPTFVNRLEEDDFYCLKGDKIAPMYTRLLSEQIAEFDNLWDLHIPVDTHTKTLTKYLTGNPIMTNDDVRAWWVDMSNKHRIDRHIIDGALWQIGNNWDNWGEDYWNEVVSE